MPIPIPHERVKILLVDDQPGKLLSLEAILAELDEELLTATNGSEALDTLLKNEVALILVDVCMPDQDGFELVETIRMHHRFQSTAIIFVSAIQMSDIDRIKGYASGAVDYVSVPVVPEILRAKVRIFVDLYRKTRQLESLNSHLESLVKERTVELENAQASLREQDKRKDEFLATLAHELRNPLAPIRSCIDILKTMNSADPSVLLSVDILGRQVTQMVRLIDELMDLSRITQGKLELKKATVSLQDVFAFAFEQSQATLKGKDQRLEISMPDSSVKLYGDGTRLTQVLANILNNASKFSNEGEKVVVRAKIRGTSVLVEVEDRGAGISTSDLEQIFQPFFQSEHKPENAGGGLGIGLTLAKRIVEMHGGDIFIRSEGLGKGTTVGIELPLLAERRTGLVTDRAIIESIPKEGGSLKVLVVDDNVDAAKTLERLFEIDGHCARAVFGGQQAIDTLGDFQPDLVVMDIGMPGMTGYEAAKTIRGTHEFDHCFLVALTGWGQDEDRRKSLEAGFDYHLVKPVEKISIDKLVAEIRKKNREKTPIG